MPCRDAHAAEPKVLKLGTFLSCNAKSPYYVYCNSVGSLAAYHSCSYLLYDFEPSECYLTETVCPTPRRFASFAPCMSQKALQMIYHMCIGHRSSGSHSEGPSWQQSRKCAFFNTPKVMLCHVIVLPFATCLSATAMGVCLSPAKQLPLMCRNLQNS